MVSLFFSVSWFRSSSLIASIVIPQQVIGQDNQDKGRDGEKEEKLGLQISQERHCRSSQEQPRLQCIWQGNLFSFSFLVLYRLVD